MAVPPTSPLRTLPQPVAVDVQGFMPQGDLFQKTMGAYEMGSKLPLLQEQIKHEKKRIKMENAKLDFAMSEAGRMQQEEENRRAQVLADVELATAQANLTKAQNEARGAEIIDRGISLASAADGARPGTSEDMQIDETSVVQPLAEENLFGADFGTRMIPSPSETEVLAAAAPQATAEESTVYVPKFVRTKPIEDLELPDMPGALGSRDVSGYAQGVINEKLAEEFPPFIGARRDEAKYTEERRKRMLELQDKYKPVKGVKEFKDDRGLPIALPVVTVGDEVVDIVGAPYIDTSKLSKAQLKRDEKFEETIIDPQFVANRVTRDSNLERLMNAAQYLVEAKDNWNPFDSRVAGILPESVRNLFGSDREKARNEARTVIQQQLRATLGAQFAFKEGEQMLNRSFNLLFDDASNLAMLKNAAQNILTVSREYDHALNYYDNNQTLAGFTFNTGLVTEHPVLSKFDEAIREVGKANTPKASAPSVDAKQKTLDRLRQRGPFGTRS